MRLQQVCDQHFPTKIDCYWWWLRYDDTEALIIFGNKRNQTNFLWWQGSVVFTFHSATGCAYYKAQPQSIHHNSQKWWISEVISITRLVCFRYDWRTREGRADAQGPVERSCRGNLAHRANQSWSIVLKSLLLLTFLALLLLLNGFPNYCYW